jgi:hypothetical protein
MLQEVFLSLSDELLTQYWNQRESIIKTLRQHVKHNVQQKSNELQEKNKRRPIISLFKSLKIVELIKFLKRMLINKIQ